MPVNGGRAVPVNGGGGQEDEVAEARERLATEGMCTRPHVWASG